MSIGKCSCSLKNEKTTEFVWNLTKNGLLSINTRVQFNPAILLQNLYITSKPGVKRKTMDIKNHGIVQFLFPKVKRKHTIIDKLINDDMNIGSKNFSDQINDE